MFGLELGTGGRTGGLKTGLFTGLRTGLSPPSKNCPVISSFSPGHFDGKSSRSILTTDLVQVF